MKQTLWVIDDIQLIRKHFHNLLFLMLFQQLQEQLLHYDIYEFQHIYRKRLTRKYILYEEFTVMELICIYKNNCNDEYEILNLLFHLIAKKNKCIPTKKFSFRYFTWSLNDRLIIVINTNRCLINKNSSISLINHQIYLTIHQQNLYCIKHDLIFVHVLDLYTKKFYLRIKKRFKLTIKW